MILANLVNYYEEHCADIDHNGRSVLPPMYYKDDYICAVIVLNKEGNIIRVENHLDSKGRGEKRRVPANPKRTSGIAAFPFVDKSDYVIGCSLNKEKKSTIIKYTDRFNAFKKLNTELLEQCNSPSALSFKRFLNSWNPEHSDYSIFDDIFLQGKLIAFKLEGNTYLLHEEPEVMKIWEEFSKKKQNEAKCDTCFVTGMQNVPLQAIQPAIKGLVGGTAEMSIISFNDNAYESYGKVNSENFQISCDASFKYVSALNYLLNNEKHFYRYADSTLVYWASAPKNSSGSHFQEEKYSDLLSMLLAPPSDDQENAKLGNIIRAFGSGRNYIEKESELDPNTRFYLLSISPQSSRICIRFYLESTFGELAKNFEYHFEDFSLEGVNKCPSFFEILIQTVRHVSNQKPDVNKIIKPNLSSSLFKSVLSGTAYPTTLYYQILERIRSDKYLSSLRFAIIKAYLNRLYRQHRYKEKISMSLDKNIKNEAYLLGRLFALIQSVQYHYNKDVNRDVADKFLSSASVKPAFIFPKLLSLCNKYLSKIKADKPGLAINLNKQIMEILDNMQSQFPGRLDSYGQGTFLLGYYHQRQLNTNQKSTDSLRFENND